MTKEKSKQGKANRAAGKRFELKVREDLEKNGWIVFRNSNDVEFKLEEQFGNLEPKPYKFSQAKTKWNPFTKRPMMTQSGFPDFVCIHSLGFEIFKDSPNAVFIRRFEHSLNENLIRFTIKFVEVKTNGTLDKIEKEKVEWIKSNLKIPVIVASKDKFKRGIIVYKEPSQHISIHNKFNADSKGEKRGEVKYEEK